MVAIEHIRWNWLNFNFLYRLRSRRLGVPNLTGAAGKQPPQRGFLFRGISPKPKLSVAPRLAVLSYNFKHGLSQPQFLRTFDSNLTWFEAVIDAVVFDKYIWFDTGSKMRRQSSLRLKRGKAAFSVRIENGIILGPEVIISFNQSIWFEKALIEDCRGENLNERLR